MKRKLLLLFLTASLGFASAQVKQPEILTNAKIVSMVKAGLPKAVIISAIQTKGSNFDLSTNAMILLKKQGVPDEVITAMSNGKPDNFSSSPVSSTVITKPSGTDEAIATMEPGIYYLNPQNRKPSELEASVFSQAKIGSGILSAMTYGIAKTKAKAVLSGTQSNFQITDTNPVFYFVFPHNHGNGIGNESAVGGGWYSNATSPNEFLLVKFKVINTSKAKGREVVTGTFGTYSGFSGGIDDENKVSYRFNKVSQGVYKVFFEAPIPEGEYAFIFAGTAATTTGNTPSQKAFDFSVVK